MDLRLYFSRKKNQDPDTPVDTKDKESAEVLPALDECSSSQTQDIASSSHDQLPVGPPHPKNQHLSASEKRIQYRATLSYKKEWKVKYPWVSCEDPTEGMFCTICQKWGKPTPGSRGACITKGITEWSHATEVLRVHGDSRCHKDAAVTAAMAKQAESGKSVLQLQCSVAAEESARRRGRRNREILLKLLRSIYFLAKNKIVHTTVYPDLIALQVANGDGLLEEHVTKGPSNVQYTSKFGAVMPLEALDTWLERNLLQSLKSSPYFSILADECQNISSQEELSICCRWIVDGRPEEHFLDILHVKEVDAASITRSLTSFMQEKMLDFRRLVGQGYDRAATFLVLLMVFK